MVVSISFTVPANVRVSVPTVIVSVAGVPKSPAIVSVVSRASRLVLTAFADTRVS